MPYIIGLSSVNRDSTVSLITPEGELLAVISEERFSRVKQQGGFPHRGMKYIFDRFSLTPEKIDSVCYSFLNWRDEASEKNRALDIDRQSNHNGFFDPLGKYLHRRLYTQWNNQTIRNQERYNNWVIEGLEQYGLVDKLRFYHHHYSHATSAYYMSGFDDCLIVSIDYYGSGLSGQISIGRNGKIEAINDVLMPNSLGMFYAQVTGALGFRTSRHEGKVLGLAAYGKETLLYRWLRKRVYAQDGSIRFPLSFANSYYCRIQKRLFSREDMAYAYQRVLEEVTTGWVSHFVKKHGIRNIAMVGGVAANVKNNQRVYELDGVDSIFVQPDMGDGGAGLGAALGRAFELGSLKVRQIDSIYMGPSYTDDEIEEALKKRGINYTRSDNIEKEIAEIVAADEIVARFDGGMEFGPRALGNRTIIAPATDPTINKTLNDRLDRTEFMPFAPATLVEDIEDCYINVKGAQYAASFMTITFDCKPLMKEKCPAAVHVDGTARPQIVDERRNPSFYKVIKYYKEMTGIPSVINTSFNIHEEPIVCSPDDAVRAFLEANLDNLAIGSFLARLKDNLENVASTAKKAKLTHVAAK